MSGTASTLECRKNKFFGRPGVIGGTANTPKEGKKRKFFERLGGNGNTANTPKVGKKLGLEGSGVLVAQPIRRRVGKKNFSRGSGVIGGNANTRGVRK